MRDALGFIWRSPRVLSLVTVKSGRRRRQRRPEHLSLLAVMFGVGPYATGMHAFAARGLGALIGPLVLRRVLSSSVNWLPPGLAVSLSIYGLAYLLVSRSAPGSAAGRAAGRDRAPGWRGELDPGRATRCRVEVPDSCAVGSSPPTR